MSEECTFSDDQCCNMLTVILFLVLLLVIFFAAQKYFNNTQTNTQVTDSNIIMFGRDNCPWCKKQKEELQGTDGIEYVDCENEPDRCTQNNVTALPTWIIHGGKSEGFLTKQEYEDKIKK